MQEWRQREPSKISLEKYSSCGPSIIPSYEGRFLRKVYLNLRGKKNPPSNS